jgi:hypothetical protein
MSWLKIISATAIIICILGITTIDCAVAGEKTKWHGTGVTSNWQQIEVGDEKGHVLAIFEGKQVFINETTGEKMVTIAKNTMDLNPKAGQITIQGYGVTTDPNGDKLIRKHEGKAIGKGHMKGTWSCVKGTGKYEGTTGGGTWESWSLAPQIGYYEVEGDMVIPKQ